MTLVPAQAHRLSLGGLGPARSTSCYACRMAREISQRELRNDSGEIMRKLDEGETFVITRNGVPVGELTPLRRHRFVAAEAAVALFRKAPSVDYQRLRTDLDAVADQDSRPRA
jgi:prevent-host-death family protein